MQQRRLAAGLFLMAAALVVAVLALISGPVSLSFRELLVAFNRFIDNSQTAPADIILWHIRIPRLLLGLMVGAGLAVCGAVMQGLFRNPLADPSLIGVSSGASFGAAFAIVMAGQMAIVSSLRIWLIPLFAFVAGMLVTIVVYRIASTRGKTQVATLLLAGVAMMAIAEAGVGLMTYLADDNQLRDITYWRLGSLGGAQWQTLGVTATFLLPSLWILLHQSRGLNAMLLGEAEASHVGIKVERLKLIVIVFSALLIGAAVSAAGTIGFIGLVVPHLIRLHLGADHRFLLPASALLGGVILVLADIVARQIVSPAELPIGILTALIGGPFFVYLLLQQRAKVIL